MSEIRIEDERETPRGWTFRVILPEPAGRESHHDLSLSWADYDHWSRGAAPPAQVARWVVRFLINRGEPIPARFDAATLRRRFPGFDAAIGAMS